MPTENSSPTSEIALQNDGQTPKIALQQDVEMLTDEKWHLLKISYIDYHFYSPTKVLINF